jgi:hypothetical protein
MLVRRVGLVMDGCLRPLRGRAAQRHPSMDGCLRSLRRRAAQRHPDRRLLVDGARGWYGYALRMVVRVAVHLQVDLQPPGLFGLPSAGQRCTLSWGPALRRHFLCTNGRKWHAEHASVTQRANARALQESMRSEGGRRQAGFRRRRIAGWKEGRRRRARGEWGERSEGAGGDGRGGRGGGGAPPAAAEAGGGGDLERRSSGPEDTQAG